MISVSTLSFPTFTSFFFEYSSPGRFYTRLSAQLHSQHFAEGQLTQHPRYERQMEHGTMPINAAPILRTLLTKLEWRRRAGTAYGEKSRFTEQINQAICQTTAS